MVVIVQILCENINLMATKANFNTVRRRTDLPGVEKYNLRRDISSARETDGVSQSTSRGTDSP
jgi:hypothetical protein